MHVCAQDMCWRGLLALLWWRSKDNIKCHLLIPTCLRQVSLVAWICQASGPMSFMRFPVSASNPIIGVLGLYACTSNQVLLFHGLWRSELRLAGLPSKHFDLLSHFHGFYLVPCLLSLGSFIVLKKNTKRDSHLTHIYIFKLYSHL